MIYVEKEKNFNAIEGRKIHNVMQEPDKNKFWLFDNEYSIYAGYNFMYNRGHRLEYTKFYWLQEQILQTLCLFNENLVLNIQRLADMSSPYEYLLQYIKTQDPLYNKLEESAQVSPVDVSVFRTRFHERLKHFLAHVNFCAVL